MAAWLAVLRVFLFRTPTFGRPFQSCAADQAHLRSHSGAGASDVLCGCLTAPEFKITPLVFRTIVSERLRLPLLLTKSTCERGAALDGCGRHRAACPRSGRLKYRATAPERGGSYCENTREAPRSEHHSPSWMSAPLRSLLLVSCCGHHTPIRCDII